MQITPTNAAWLAGFLDGEGCFQIAKYRKRYKDRVYEGFTPVVSATGTDRRPLDHCREIVGGKVTGPIGRRQVGSARPAYRWELNGRALGPALAAILPYLCLKGEHAQLLISLRDEIQPGARAGEWGVRHSGEQFERRALMKLAMGALNHRGSTPPLEDQVKALALLRSEAERHQESAA